MSPISWYENQLNLKEEEYRKLSGRIQFLSRLRVVVGISFLLAIYFSFSNGSTSTYIWWLSALVLVIFLYLVKRHNYSTEQLQFLRLHTEMLREEIRALQGDISPFNSGTEYIDAEHPFAYDLDMFGGNSIFQMLCRTVTVSGTNALAVLLQYPYAAKDEVETRQAGIQELSANPEFLQKFRVSGKSIQEGKNDREKVLSWLGMTDKFMDKRLLVVAAAIVPVLSVSLIGWSIYQQAFSAGLVFVLVLNWTCSIIYGAAIKETHMLVGRNSKLIDKYEALVADISLADAFVTGQLHAIQQNAIQSSKGILQFKKLVHLFDSRQNGMVGPFMNSFFLFDINCVLRLERWRKTNKNTLLQAVADIEEMDRLISLSVFAFNNPEYKYPTVNDTAVKIEGKDIKHPLLKKSAAIGNDVSLGVKERFYLLTGANMTGKSTFMRTVGVNLLLAYTGLPLPVAALDVPVIRVYTAIRISDSVQDDISYFKAELNRIKSIMHELKSANVPYMVLLDEPLRGTNSVDKQAGTRAMVEKLVSLNAIGIVATHDAGLCNMEDKHRGAVSNYHFESSVQEGALIFDFKLKPGSSQSNNATILMQQMGII
jgi:hypothetical protein